jgi:hypothetical protein
MRTSGEYLKYTGLDSRYGSRAIYEVLAGGVTALRQRFRPGQSTPELPGACSQVTIDEKPAEDKFLVAHSLGRGCETMGHDHSLLRVAVDTGSQPVPGNPKLFSSQYVDMHLTVEFETSALILDTAHRSDLEARQDSDDDLTPRVGGGGGLWYAGPIASLPSLRLVLDTARLIMAAPAETNEIERLYRHMLSGLIHNPNYTDLTSHVKP